MSSPTPDSCAPARGSADPAPAERVLVVVFATAVGEHLLRYAADVGYRASLVEPERARAGEPGVPVLTAVPAELAGVDVVVTDHHRPELGAVLRDALRAGPRWVGVMGSPRHPAPHVPALEALGVPGADIAGVHRPIGLDIGSRTPAEIAIATVAGLLADRNGRPGGFGFDTAMDKVATGQ